VPDANLRIPASARDRFAEIAAAEGLSLRAYLARLAETMLTPAERAERARAVLREWTWSTAHTQYAAQPCADRPDGAVVATATPQAWKKRPVRILDLSP